MPVTTVTREQLYERIWQTPTVHLCKEFGLSDVGLAKLCKRHKIPKPYLGYWARKAAGGNPKRLRLPKCSDPSLAEIQVFQSEVPMQPSGFFDPEIEALYEAELKRDRIVVPAELDSPLPIVERTQRVLLNGRQLKSPIVAASMSKPLVPRAMRIIDALLKGLLERGYTIENEGYYAESATPIRGHGHEFGIRIREPLMAVKREDKYFGGMRTEYDPSGRIQLEIEGFGSWSPKHIRDGKQSTIEDRVGILPAQMLEAIDNSRRERAEREEKERKRQAELHAKWEAEERAKELARQAAEKKRREEALFKRARQWKRCQELREFVHAVRDLAEERPLPEGAQQEAAGWIEWAMGVADAYDPLATWAEQPPERVQKPR
jgi:hypothetical protein